MSYTVELLVDHTLVLHRIIPMLPDGNCLFHSLGFSLFNSTDTQQANSLRVTIVEYVCRNWEDLRVYTCSETGDPFGSEEEYRASMLQSTTYGAVSELMAAAALYAIKIEVYQDGVLRGSFGEAGHPTKRLLFSGSLSSGHYDVCVPVEQDVSNEFYFSDTLVQNEPLNLKKAPKQNEGRLKTTEKSREDERREANQRYRNAHPEVVQNYVKRYVDKNPEVHQKNVKRYSDKYPEVHQHAVRRYTDKNPQVHQQRYTQENPEVRRESTMHYTKKNPDINKSATKLYYARKRLAYTAKYDVIKNLTETLGKQKRQEGENFVKWALELRKNMLDKYYKDRYLPSFLHKK